MKIFQPQQLVGELQIVGRGAKVVVLVVAVVALHFAAVVEVPE